MTDLAAEASPKPQRLMSLDVLRGMTIAGMLLVNNPGSWSSSKIYWPLQHAAWNGWTFTDLIFPFFLFMVGVAMMFSFPKRLERGESRANLFAHVARRAIVLIMLGFWGATFPFWPGRGQAFEGHEVYAWGQGFFADLAYIGTAGFVLRIGYALAFLSAVVLITGTVRPKIWGSLLGLGTVIAIAGGAGSGLTHTLADGTVLNAADPMFERLASARWPGVLVRIGICYLFASAIYFLTPRPKAIIKWIVALLAIYWIWMLYIPIPGFGAPDLIAGFPTSATPVNELFSNWCFYIDYNLLGEHVWSYRTLRDANGELIWSFDPEGLLSTISAVCSVLFGILTGLWLQRRETSPTEKTNSMFVWGCALCAIGLVLSIWMPINKRIWTSSYTVFMAGMALLCLGMCYHVIDVKGYRKWAMPFKWFGMNAITAFFFSGMMAGLLGRLKVETITAAGESQLISWKGWIYSFLCKGFSDINASLIFAVSFVLIWTAIMGVMYRYKIFLKI